MPIQTNQGRSAHIQQRSNQSPERSNRYPADNRQRHSSLGFAHLARLCCIGLMLNAGVPGSAQACDPWSRGSGGLDYLDRILILTPIVFVLNLVATILIYGAIRKNSMVRASIAMCLVFFLLVMEIAARGSVWSGFSIWSVVLLIFSLLSILTLIKRESDCP